MPNKCSSEIGFWSPVFFSDVLQNVLYFLGLCWDRCVVWICLSIRYDRGHQSGRLREHTTELSVADLTTSVVINHNHDINSRRIGLWRRRSDDRLQIGLLCHAYHTCEHVGICSAAESDERHDSSYQIIAVTHVCSLYATISHRESCLLLCRSSQQSGNWAWLADVTDRWSIPIRDSIRFVMRIDSFCKKNRPFDSLVVMQFLH